MSEPDDAPRVGATNVVLQPHSLVSLSLVGSATASTRTNFATHHLRAAIRAARTVHEVEQANAGVEFGPWFDDMLMLVPVSVVMAGAALEATANEIIQDILDGSSGLPLTIGRKALLADLKEDRSGSSLDRYRRLALLFDQVPEMGVAAWEDAKLLVRFRNTLMHFKPAWDHEKGDGKLAAALRGKFPTQPAYQSNFQLPFGCMTYGCARWCVQSALAFSAMFSALLGVPDRFARSPSDFELPT